MRKRIKRYLPDPGQMRASRWLRWLGPALHHPRVWHLSRRGVALGCAIGVFFGLLIPVAQIPLSAGMAIALRANLPAAVGSTLVSNPLTFGPLYYAAYRLGAALTGETARPVAEAELAQTGEGVLGWLESWWHRVASLGKPLIVGLGTMATTLALATYFAILGLWRAATVLAWRRRARRDRE
jgi:uncharacterized protein (DUF2062 family)